jgi:hypothetical protein
VRLHATAGGAAIDILIDRRAAGRQRLVEIDFMDGGTATLDFAVEPGHIRIDNKSVPPDPSWGVAPSPLTASLAGFLSAVETAGDWPLAAAAVLDSVRGAATASALLLRAEVELVARQLASAGAGGALRNLDALILDNVVPELAGKGVRITHSDQERIVGLAADILDGSADACRQLDDLIATGVCGSHFLAQVVERTRALRA